MLVWSRIHWLLVLAAAFVSSARADLPNGVAAGDTTLNSSVLWARSTAPGPLSFEYSIDPTFSTGLSTVATAVADPLIPATADISGLTPGTRYYYRATDASGASVAGTFKTSAPPGVSAGFRFGVAADWRGELRPYPALANVADRNLDLLVELGDTVYADVPTADVPAPAQSLTDFRRKHQEVYSARFGTNTLATVRGSTAVLATIDDHEVIDNWAGGASPTTDPRFGPTPELFINDTPLYDNALQAFQEYNPVRSQFYGATLHPRTSGERKLYRASRYGQDAAVFVLDNRSFRDQELPAIANPTDPLQVAGFVAASYTPGRTMLGAAQLADLKADLLSAQTAGVTWKFVVTGEPIQLLGPIEAQDRWEGYQAERTELLSFINNNHLDNVVFVSADLHALIVNNLTYATAPLGPQVATQAFEVVVPAAAYDAPLGPVVVELLAAAGAITPAQLALYNSLPTAGKDAFVRSIASSSQTPLGYDTIGLEGSNIPATLLEGSYFAAHDFGWTEFDIDSDSQLLTVTTYGIDRYTQAEIEADANAILNRQPVVISRFVVQPVPEPSTFWLVVASGLGVGYWRGHLRRVLGNKAQRRAG